MFLARKVFLVLMILVINDCLIDRVYGKRGGGFGRGLSSSSSYSRRRKPTSSSSSYRAKYNSRTSSTQLRKPSAPPAESTFRQSAPVAGLNTAAGSPPKIDNQKPIGWNIPPNNQQTYPKQQQPLAPGYPNQPPPAYPNQPPPTYYGAHQPAYQPPPAYSPHQPAPGYYQPQPPPVYNTNGFQTGVFQPPKRSGFGLGSIAGSSTLGNVLTGLTLWQVLKGNSYRGVGGYGSGGYGPIEGSDETAGSKTVNIYNNYYNGTAVPINEPITNTDNVPIKQRFENGTLVLNDDTIVYPNGTLVLQNGTVFNTIADIQSAAAVATPLNQTIPVTLAPPAAAV